MQLRKSLADNVEDGHLRARAWLDRFLYARAYRAVVPGYVFLAYLHWQDVDRQERCEWTVIHHRLRHIADVQRDGAPPRALERPAVRLLFLVDRFLLSKAVRWALGCNTGFLWPAGFLYRNVVYNEMGRLLHDASFYGPSDNGEDMYELVEAWAKNSAEHVKDI